MKLGIHKTFKGKRLYEEIWKPIEKGQKTRYEISNKGRVKSFNYKNTGTIGILNPAKDRRGYCFIALYFDNKPKIFRVHRLVAETFIPNPNNKPCVDHINRVRTDNRVQNLRWVTCKENMNNELTKEHLSNINKGKKHSEETKSKLRKINQTRRKVICVETGIIYNSISEAEAQTNATLTGIVKCCTKVRKTSGGFHWAYI